jgi:hypothetical protein
MKQNLMIFLSVVFPALLPQGTALVQTGIEKLQARQRPFPFRAFTRTSFNGTGRQVNPRAFSQAIKS